MSDTRTIVLIGLSGAGKSTVARLLSERLGARALDLDAAIEGDAQASVAQIFAREGEAGFRRREVERLSSVLRDAPAVLACGGGVILEPEARALLSAGCRVVWLEVSPVEAARRLGDGLAVRPLLAGGPPQLEVMLAERRGLYGQIAEVRVATDGRTPEQVADEVIASLGPRGSTS
jgi:shikimate kinase